MTDEEYKRFTDTCYAELETKQSAMTDQLGIGAGGPRTTRLDLGTEQLLFFHNGVLSVMANIVPIGSFHVPSNSWMWGWANDTFGESLQYKASRLMNLAKVTGRKHFVTETISADAGTIWELAAMGVCHLGSEGCYRVPSGECEYFYALFDLQKHDS